MRKLITLLLLGLALTALAGRHKTQSTKYQLVPNQGQFDKRVQYKVELPSGAMFMENNALTYHFYDAHLFGQLHHGEYQGDTSNVIMHFHAYRMTFVGANDEPEKIPEDPYAHYFNYFLGNNPDKWASKVPSYQKVKYRELYPGIDFVMYNHEDNSLKYDLIVQPKGNPNQVVLNYEGLDSIYLSRGRLHIITSLGETWEEKPEAWQMVDGKKKKVACHYLLDGHNVRFEFPKGYDHERELIIDPILIFSSYTGSTTDNFGYTAAFDKYGYLYSGSSAFGISYPTVIGSYDLSWNGGTGGAPIGLPQFPGTDMAITKWDTNGMNLIYSTYLGGSSDELPHSLIVSEFDELFVMGTTGSTDFPTTPQAFDTSFSVHPNGPIPVNLLGGVGVYYLNGCDIVVTKFDSSGSVLQASTFLGGTLADGLNNGNLKFNYADEFRGEVLLDNEGKVYIASCTRSDDNPVTSIGFQTTKPGPANNIDGIVFKLDHNLSTLHWTNYIGTAGADAIYSISIDNNNDIYVSGGTNSNVFPVTPNAYDTTHNGAIDAFVAKFSGDGNSLEYSTYYGSPAYDQSYFVELDRFDNAYIFGQTAAPTNQLIFNANYNNPNGGQFITKFTPQLDSVIWATRFGSGDGTPDISPTAFLVDVCSAIYLSGWGSQIQGGLLSTTGLDTAGGPIQGTTDGNDFYLMVLSDDASSLIYATFFGGSSAEHVDGGTSRFDKKGKIYQAVCAGCGGISDFPTTPGAWSNVNGSTNCNLGVFKMDFLLPIVVADFAVPTTACAPFNASFSNLSLQQSATNFFWDFGDGSTSNAFQPNHLYPNAGTYNVMLVVSDTLTCNLSDTLFKTITILGDSNYALPTITSCLDEGVEIGIANNNDPSLTFTWSPTTGLSDTTVANPIANPLVNTTYILSIDNGICQDTATQLVEVDSVKLKIVGDSVVCSVDAPFLLTGNSFGTGEFFYWSEDPLFGDTINADTTDSTILVNPVDSFSIYYLRAISDGGCIIDDTFTIAVLDLIFKVEASFADPGVGCAPYSVNFINTTDSLPGSTYVWDFGTGGGGSTDDNPSYTYSSRGTYTVTLIAFDSSICPQSDTFTMEVGVRADSNYTVNHLACLGQETQIGIPPDSVVGTTYTWIPTTGLSDPTIAGPTVTLTQNFTYLLVVQHVCTDSVTDIVTVEPIYSQTEPFKVVCSDNPVVNLSGSSQGTGIGFIWSSTADISDTLNNSPLDSTVSINVNEPISTYYFQVESLNGCLETDSTIVVISDQMVAVSPDSFICQGDTLLLAAVNLFPQNPMDYVWSPVSDIIGPNDTSTIMVAPSVTTTYYLNAVNDSGCLFKDTVLVNVSLLNNNVVNATADHDSLLLGFTTVLHAVPPGYLYSWSPTGSLANPNDANTEATPDTTTTFEVIVSDPGNTSCSYKSGVTVIVYEINCGEPDIFIPNAFSPNGDGENDELFVRGKVVEEMNLKIYSRWGELMYESNNRLEGWDGKYKGEYVNPAVFVYQLEVTCIDGRNFSKKGNVTLVR